MAQGHALLLERTTDAFARNLDDALNPEPPTGLSDDQLYTLKLVSLCLSCISIASAILAFYWFIRIRRSFRHDLIMLLIQSDMFKAVWTMIFPIVDFTHGPIKSSSTFCQVSGFFLSVGIEASDIAVVLIAVHAALYIFRPRGSRGDSGLYPYRRIAYAIFFIVPHIMASLAFLNEPHAYANVGEYCYLPVKPSWARMALSWIPRYVVFLTILIIYACIYFYVMFLIRRFGRLGPRSTPSSHPQRRSAVPPLPPIAHHGLIPSSAHGSNDRERQNSASTTGSLKLDTSRHDWAQPRPHSQRGESEPPPPQGEAIDWKWSDFGGNIATRLSSDDGETSPTTATPPASLLQEPAPLRTRDIESPEPPNEPVSEAAPARPTWRLFGRSGRPTGSRSRKESAISIFSILRQGPPRGSYSSTSSYRMSHGGGRGSSSFPSPMHNNMAKTREKIRRQLRLLFIYPIVYLVIWVVPFVSHIFKWDDPADPGPFGVLVVSLASLCIQGAVNSWLFSTREKPWRFTKKKTAGGRWRRWHAHAAAPNTRATTVGRTREEMLVDGRNARRRRVAEIEERRRAESGRRGTLRHWWDVLDVELEMDTSDEESLL